MALSNLVTKECAPCRGGITPMTHGQIRPLAEEIENWQVMNDHHLSRTFVFLDFSDAMKFVNKVADVAEHEDHHPDFSISYNTVRLDIWTHKIGGLSENDFILAAKIDAIIQSWKR